MTTLSLDEDLIPAQVLSRLIDQRLTELDRTTPHRDLFAFKAQILNECRTRSLHELLAHLVDAYRTKLNAAVDARHDPAKYEAFYFERGRVTELQWLVDELCKAMVLR